MSNQIIFLFYYGDSDIIKEKIHIQIKWILEQS